MEINCTKSWHPFKS